MFTDGFVIKRAATFLVNWLVFCICSILSFYRVLNIELPEYKCTLTTVKPCYLAQLFSQLCWNTGHFLFHSPYENVAYSLSLLLTWFNLCNCLKAHGGLCGAEGMSTFFLGRHIVSWCLYPGKFEYNVTFESWPFLVALPLGASHRRYTIFFGL